MVVFPYHAQQRKFTSTINYVWLYIGFVHSKIKVADAYMKNIGFVILKTGSSITATKPLANMPLCGFHWSKTNPTHVKNRTQLTGRFCTEHQSSSLGQAQYISYTEGVHKVELEGLPYQRDWQSSIRSMNLWSLGRSWSPGLQPFSPTTQIWW